MKIFHGAYIWLTRRLQHLRYTPILGSAALLGLIRIGVYARLLDVDGFGLLSKLLLISGLFCVAGSFGFQIVAQRDLPAMFAQKRYRRGLVMLAKAGIVTSAAALAVCCAPLFGYAPLQVSLLALAVAVLHGWGQQVFMLLVLDSRSRLDMTRYSMQILVRTASAFLVACAVAWCGGGGVAIMLAELLVTIVLAGIMLLSMLRKTCLSWAVLWRVGKRGFDRYEWRGAAILLIGTTLAFLSTSADRWLAADFLDVREFGLYSFSWIPLVAALSIQALLNAGLFPLIAQRRVAGSDAQALQATMAVSFGLLLVSLLVAFVANQAAAWIIPKWYEQYVGALPLLPPLLFAAAFRVSDFWSSYLIIVHRHVSLLATQALLIVAAFLYCRFALAGSAWTAHPYNFTLLALFLAGGNYAVTALVSFTTREKTVS